MKNKLLILTAIFGIALGRFTANAAQPDFRWNCVLPESLAAGTKLTITADGADATGNMIVALYAGKALTQCTIQESDTATISLPSAFSTDRNWTLKAFLWDGHMTPMEKCLELPLATEPDITDAFPDARFLRAVREIIKKGENEPIYPSDVDQIQTLNVRNKDIQSLEGIAQFSSLKSLECWGNPLTELDVSGNQQLQKLLCYGCDFPTLDVTNLLQLEILDCSFNTELTALDVSHNTALQILDCRYTNLTALEITDHPALTELLCPGCELKRLTISHANSLQELECWGNQLTALDTSACPNLVLLDCENNNLKTIDVSNNRALTRLECRKNQMESPADVIGWEQTGLILEDTFLFQPQKQGESVRNIAH